MKGRPICTNQANVIKLAIPPGMDLDRTGILHASHTSRPNEDAFLFVL